MKISVVVSLLWRRVILCVVAKVSEENFIYIFMVEMVTIYKTTADTPPCYMPLQSLPPWRASIRKA
jgi:hypothetical protein